MNIKRGDRALTLLFDKQVLSKSKRSQMELSFGVIFSIILIIIFVVFAFYAIQKFLEIQRIAQIGKFIDDFQHDVDKMWKGPQGAKEESYVLPTKVDEVCFDRDGDILEVYFEPPGSGEGQNYVEIKNVRLSAPCIETEEGRVTILIKKEFGDTLVRIDDTD